MTSVNTPATEIPGAHFSSLGERVRAIREEKALTREQFSERTRVNVNTLKAIEQKGVVPGGEVLVKIAFAFPEHALWLLTEMTQKVGGHLAPRQAPVGDRVTFTIINQFDARYPEECAVKPRALSARAVFITDEHAVDIACAIPLNTRTGTVEDVVWASYGSLSLTGERPKLAMTSFIEWLKDIGIERFELVCLANQLDQVEHSRVIWESQLRGGEALESAAVQHARENLSKWCK